MNQIFTIGHSNYEFDEFLSILNIYNINAIVDIRSVPYSRYNPQYNQDSIKKLLKSQNIHYIYLGNCLGARYDDESLLFDDGQVDFEKVSKTKEFRNGIDRLIDGIKKGFTISLMCSEKEAFDCHRFCLVSKYLKSINIDVNHIYQDKLVSQSELEKNLINKYQKKLPKENLFDKPLSKDKELELCYYFRNKDIGYKA
jgi:uncharacterized protein (DUF488 family)